MNKKEERQAAKIAKQQAKIEKKSEKASMKMKLGWSSLGFSAAMSYTLMAYLSLYATDVMGLSIGAVGIALFLSKIFDGISDILVGMLIDKTNSRWGKARPYALAIVGYWICVGLLFSAPDIGQVGGVIYLFAIYTIANAVFTTMYAVAEAPHLANAIKESSQSLSLIGFGSVIAAFGGLIAGIALPQFIAAAGTSHAAWSKLAWIMAIPLALIGSFRFILVKEIKGSGAVVDTATSDKTQSTSLKDLISALRHNKYILLLSVLVFISYFASFLNSSSTTYYAKYIIGDIGVQSLFSLGLIPLIIMMGLIPTLARKFTLKKCIYVMMIIGLVGSLIKLIAPANVALNFLSACMTNVAFPAFYGFAGTLVIDCMDYGEWKNGIRVEGLMGSVQSVMNKVGSGLGTAIGGVLLGIAGYNGMLETQSGSATTMIIALTTTIPAGFYIVFMIIYRFYDLDGKLPKIREELKAKATANIET